MGKLLLMLLVLLVRVGIMEVEVEVEVRLGQISKTQEMVVLHRLRDV